MDTIQLEFNKLTVVVTVPVPRGHRHPPRVEGCKGGRRERAAVDVVAARGRYRDRVGRERGQEAVDGRNLDVGRVHQGDLRGRRVHRTLAVQADVVADGAAAARDAARGGAGRGGGRRSVTRIHGVDVVERGLERKYLTFLGKEA
jgi:hypothetical protein